MERRTESCRLAVETQVDMGRAAATALPIAETLRSQANPDARLNYEVSEH